MIIHSTSGKEFECDMVSEIPIPPRLYLDLTNTTIADVATAITGENGLPFVEYPEYRFVQSIAMSPVGVNITLKKTFE